MQSILILFFFCRVEKLSIFKLSWCSRCHDTMHVCCRLPGTIICVYSLMFRRLDACQYTSRWDHYWLILPHMVPNFTSSIFSNPQLLPTSSEIYCFCCTQPHSRSIYSITFARLQCLHSHTCFYLGSNHASTFKPLHPQWHSVAPALRHTHAAALKRSAPRRRYAKEAEGPTRCTHCEGQHSDLRQLP